MTGQIQKGDCVLTMFNSMVSTSWLRKSNFDIDPTNFEGEKETELARINAEVRNDACRDDALTMMQNEICYYTQVFPGEKNVVVGGGFSLL